MLEESTLGKTVEQPRTYSPALLVRVPRSENRDKYGIKNDYLPFTGTDVWNCYEISFLYPNGFPFTGVAKLSYPCSTLFHVESKSLKLYLNSFNMHIVENSITFESIVTKDISNLLEHSVSFATFAYDTSTPLHPKPIYVNLDHFLLDPADTTFTVYKEDSSLLKATQAPLRLYKWKTSILRSNCKVTHQPDFGDLYLHYKSNMYIDPTSFLKYIVSFRDEWHFHEEVIEMIYKRINELIHPTELLVMGFYTRRGGIDINPIRASDSVLIPLPFTALRSRVSKTFRQ
jgi:7-cyano-7-deazaguanine reductase